jgi:hypothetical protein
MASKSNSEGQETDEDLDRGSSPGPGNSENTWREMNDIEKLLTGVREQKNKNRPTNDNS